MTLNDETEVPATKLKINALLGELASIDVWDAIYLNYLDHDLIDKHAFEARQARREQIQHDIGILREKLGLFGN